MDCLSDNKHMVWQLFCMEGDGVFVKHRESNNILLYQMHQSLHLSFVASNKHRGIFNQCNWMVWSTASPSQQQINIKLLHYWPFVRGIYQWPVDSARNGPVMWKYFACQMSTRNSVHVLTLNVRGGASSFGLTRSISWLLKVTRTSAAMILTM